MKINSEKIEIVSIKTLKPHPKNPNLHSEEQILSLIKEFKENGIRHPLVYSNLSKTIVAGCGRLEALNRLSIKKVPITRQDFPNEAKEFSFMVYDNEIKSYSSLDLEQVHLEAKSLEISLEDLAIDLPSIDNDIYGPEEDNQDDLVEKPKEEKSKTHTMIRFKVTVDEAKKIEHFLKKKRREDLKDFILSLL